MLAGALNALNGLWALDNQDTNFDALVFDGFGRLTNNNNLALDSNIAGITFAPTAGAFMLGGNRITLGGDIVCCVRIDRDQEYDRTHVLVRGVAEMVSLESVLYDRGFTLRRMTQR